VSSLSVETINFFGMRSGSIPITLILLGLLFLFIFTYLFILTANGFLPGGSGTTIKHNTQITHITQNNTPPSNKTHHTKLHKQ
jgi:hypothetical protein